MLLHLVFGLLNITGQDLTLNVVIYLYIDVFLTNLIALISIMLMYCCIVTGNDKL